MNYARIRRAATVAGCALLAACATFERPTQTPQGAGFPTGRFVILGTSNRITILGDDGFVRGGANAGQEVRQSFEIDVPVGTRIIVPAVTGWDLGFGGANDMAHEPNPDRSIDWSGREDHYFGVSRVDVAVDHINAPASATMQKATLRVILRLSDYWQDKAWFGAVRYQLIFLGCADGRQIC